MTDEFKHPIERLKDELRERREKEVVECPECGTEVLKDDIEDALAVAEEHDDVRHNGERVATVNGILPSQFDESEKEQIREAVERLTEDTDA